jgi:hypothetical protein
MLTYTCLLYSSFKLLNPWPQQTAIFPHWAKDSLQLVKTCNKTCDSYRPATGLGRVARNTNNLRKRFIHVAELLQNTEFLFCFCTVSLGWRRTNFHVLWPPKRLVTGNLRTDCFWTEVYDLWENTNYCRGSFPRKPNCVPTNLTAYHGKSDSIFANRVHPVSLRSTTLSTTILLERNFLTSLSCYLFHALYMIYKSVQHPQMHSFAIMQGGPKVGIQCIVCSI